MASLKQQAAERVARMTLEEKASLCSGADFWHTKAISRVEVPSVCVTDGPHGLRKQSENFGDIASLNRAVPTTCFPTACTTACSFDEALLEEMGRAMAEECLQEEVAVILGPGTNAKRSPLCGRNFEYFSEDPLLAGKCAAALIRGVEQANVGTSLKHYAANNQEDARLVSDSVVDERALREVYLPAFEIAVKEGKPATVMCSYNRINGTYACEHTRLLTDILREEWGFDGLVMTDWGAMDQRVPALQAGLDLEMPGPAPGRDAQIVQAVQNGTLPETVLDTAAARVVELALRGAQNLGTSHSYDKEAHHALARRIAAQSAVLLQNDGTLPLQKNTRLAVMGGFAKTPRYQGAGSSQITPTRLMGLLGVLEEAQVPYTYAEGFGPEQELADTAKTEEALAAAAAADAVVVCAGLPASYESEGFDREHLRLPPCQLALLEALRTTGKPLVVVLFCGSSVLAPFAEFANAVLLMGLPGQAGGGAVADILLGRCNPSGKLAETWPLAADDCGNRRWFGGRQVQYRESIYIGYRWFDKAQLPVRWCFGHGLSYTQFSYSNLQLSATALGAQDSLTVRFTVENTGPCAGSEVAQVYVSAPETTLFKPVRELRAFAKVHLQPHESITVSVVLTPRDFSYYNVPAACWHSESGAYTVAVGTSSRQLPLSAAVEVTGDRSVAVPDLRQSAQAYFAPGKACENGHFAPPQAQFEAVLGRAVPPPVPLLPYTVNSAVRDLRQTLLGRIAFKIAEKQVLKQFNAGVGVGGADASSASNLRKMQESMLYDMPLRGISMVTNGAVTPQMTQGLVDILNGHWASGIKKLRCKK